MDLSGDGGHKLASVGFTEGKEGISLEIILLMILNIGHPID